MFCVQCGQPLPNGIKFCSECGTALNRPTNSDNQNQQPAQQPVQSCGSGYVESILEYFRDILHCEAALIGFESTIQQNRSAMAKLCVSRSLSRPIPPATPMERTPSVTGRLGKAGIAGALSLTPLAPITAPIAIYQATIGMSKDKKKAQELHEQEIVLYNQKLLEYEENMRVYDAMANEENLRMSNEKAQKQLYEDQLNEIHELISRTKTTLSSLYKVNILHDKYQNLVAVASIYDYLSTGRTTSLIRVGNDPGAYNIYEEDVRIGKIMSVIEMVGNQIINTVTEVAESVQYQQQALYDAVCEGNDIKQSLLSQVISQGNRIEKGIIENTEAVRDKLKAERAEFSETNANIRRMKEITERKYLEEFNIFGHRR